MTILLINFKYRPTTTFPKTWIMSLQGILDFKMRDPEKRLCVSKQVSPDSIFVVTQILAVALLRVDLGHRVYIPRSGIEICLVSLIPLVPFSSSLAGQDLHASRETVSLGWFDRFVCRGQLESFYQILPETHSPNKLPKCLKKIGIMIPSPTVSYTHLTLPTITAV